MMDGWPVGLRKGNSVACDDEVCAASVTLADLIGLVKIQVITLIKGRPMKLFITFSVF